MHNPVNTDAVYVENGVEYHAVTQSLCVPTPGAGEHHVCSFFQLGSCAAVYSPRRCRAAERNDRSEVVWVRA